MTGDIDSIDGITDKKLIKALNKDGRKLIGEMSQKYIQLGLLDAETVNKNINTYLHRTYNKPLKDLKGQKVYDSMREIRLIGDELRPRGTDPVTITLKTFNNKEGQYQKWNAAHPKAKFIIVKDSLKDASGKKKKLKPSTKIKVFRDYTKEERIKLGEVEDATFAIAETGRLMSNDIATANFYQKLVDEDFAVSKAVFERNLGGKYTDYVQMSSSTLAGTKKKKFGAISGMYVNKEVKNDLERIYVARTNEESLLKSYTRHFNTAQTLWKKSKTAWNPAVHVNNVMSNFILLDI